LRRRSKQQNNKERVMETNQELITANEFLPTPEDASHSYAVGTAQASQEVLGAIFAAKRFPRDEYRAFNAIIKACQRMSLAESATYLYPRGGTDVTGPSIRLAEVLAASWGNIDYGIRELEQHDGYSEMQAYAWDLETNVRRTINFTVKHERFTRDGSYDLTDPRDIYEMTANQGARRVRACILALIPADVREKAVVMCKQTIAKGGGAPLEDLVKKLVVQFGTVGVTVEMLEKKIGHKLEEVSPEEYANLRATYNMIKDNMSSRDQFFGGQSSKPLVQAPKPKEKGKKKGGESKGPSKKAENKAETASQQQEPAKTEQKEVIQEPSQTRPPESPSEPGPEAGQQQDSEPEQVDTAAAEPIAEPELPLSPPVQKEAGNPVLPEEVPAGAFQVECAKRVAQLGWNAERLSTELQTYFGVTSLIEVELKNRVAVLKHLRQLVEQAKGSG
jgi:hypothetical protein